jgi:hypothetical protein
MITKSRTDQRVWNSRPRNRSHSEITQTPNITMGKQNMKRKP